jgi:hypothetical protein
LRRVRGKRRNKLRIRCSPISGGVVSLSIQEPSFGQNSRRARRHTKEATLAKLSLDQNVAAIVSLISGLSLIYQQFRFLNAIAAR